MGMREISGSSLYFPIQEASAVFDMNINIGDFFSTAKIYIDSFLRITDEKR